MILGSLDLVGSGCSFALTFDESQKSGTKGWDRISRWDSRAPWQNSTYNGGALDYWPGRQVWQECWQVVGASVGWRGRDVWETGNVRGL